MKTVQVLMSTYNGEKYIDEQIDSLIAQEGVNIRILVRDDGSNDKTITKLKKWEKEGVLKWYSGGNLKPALSFMDLVKKAPKADYYAFCDQDDYWHKDKLKVAVSMLEELNNNKPALYFSNKQLVDSNLVPIKTTKQRPKLSLGSALIINPVTGCTLTINHALLEVIRKYDNTNLYMHDAWIYRVCMALDGNVVFDEKPHIDYRQHENNVIGGTSSISKKYKRRIKNVLIQRNHIREKDAKELIKGYSDSISLENLETIKKVAFYRKSLKNKLDLVFDKNIRTDNVEHDLSFLCAVFLNAF
ncbi:MAG: glycosyltransferase family 2 protein [Bacillota bacterium]|uniref:glycosyltransferase family 2 protein n=1 Tax=Cytobacillus firmus TaxID=1399 RepID=UPI0018CF5673|nr:glycosyltransferase family 2 protein [Cytobacillus firmus]MED4447569.1 glycosyltransferase family 2 protein [Cytobacillus firmus]MED4769670.1 glycosyltransferase family 2 protein [Cytobacillus firmus]